MCIMEEEAARLFKRGISLLRRGYPEDSAECLERVLDMGYDSAACYSWLGIAIARSRHGDIIKAEEYCKKAIKKAYYRPQYYNNLAEVYLIWGKKRKAVKVLGETLNLDDSNKSAHIKLASLGIRRREVIPFLSRINPINKYLGIILTRLGLR